MSRFFLPATLILVCAACSGFAFGQAVSGTLLGTVTDASGAAVPAAKVTLTAVQTGISRSMNSNESGNYVFPNVEPGTYKVAVELKGFRTAIKEGIDVLALTANRNAEAAESTDVPLSSTDCSVRSLRKQGGKSVGGSTPSPRSTAPAQLSFFAG